MASAADVPSVYDLVLSGGGLANPVGFVFLDALEPSLPFRTHRAIYSYTPTFIERSNVSGNFGDNQQDFFLTSSQRDWSEGEQQRYYRASDQDSIRRYWQGSGVDIRIPGQASMRAGVSTITFASAAVACCSGWFDSVPPGVAGIPAASASNLFTVDATLAINNRGAHGLGATPSRWGLASDGPNVYLTTTSAGTVGVRKWNPGGGFTTFSASSADALAFLNNTLYGLRNGSGDLVRYDTAGTLTSLFTWKDAAGTAIALTGSKLVAFGGKLAILRTPGTSTGIGLPELWIYDGSGTSLIQQFPPGFIAYDIAVAQGIMFVSGTMPLASGSGTTTCPVVFYYANGTTGTLWRSYVASTVAPALVAWNEGLLFTDASTSALMFYNPTTGGVHTLTTSWPSSGSLELGAIGPAVLTTAGTTTGYGFQDSGTRLTSATLTTSLFDFDSSLTKSIRAVTVEFDSATDGNGGTVDVAYRTGDVDGSYTSLATGITSGAENLISGVTGKSISIKVTLNKGTSTNGPVLKRISVRAAPIETSFRMGEYVIDCTGDAGRSPRTLRDGTPNPLSGSESMAQLEIAKASTTPLTIKDRRGTYTGFIETLEGYEEHPGIDDPTRSGEFVVKLITRGV